MSKSTQLMGLSLKNPILVAAGPWARDGASLQPVSYTHLTLPTIRLV